MAVHLAYITCRDHEEALRIAGTLLDEKLIACANIVGNVTSLYDWEGERRREPEVLLLAKTTAARREAMIARTKELHEYDRPCIVCLPIDDGNAAFLQWVEAQWGA